MLKNEIRCCTLWLYYITDICVI